MNVPSARGPVAGLRSAQALALGLIAVLALRAPSSHPEGLLLADAVLAAGLALAARAGRLPPLRSPLVALAGVILLASAVTAADSHAAIGACGHALRLLLAGWLGASLVRSVAEASHAATVLAVAAALASLHGVAQVAFLHPRLAARAADAAPGIVAQLTDARANSVFLLPAHLGAFAAMGLAAAIGRTLAARSRWTRLISLLLALACAVGVGVAASFGGVLLAVLGAGIAGLVVLSGRGRRVAAGVGAAVALVVVTFSIVQRSGEMQRETPWGARARNWATACRLMREAPLLGHGPGGFGVAHARARDAASNDVQHAHQAFLEAGAEQGIGMLAVLAAFVGALASRAVAVLRDPLARADRATLAALVAAAAVAIAHGLLDFGWSSPTWAIPAAAILGVAWSLRGMGSGAVAGRALAAPVVALVLLMAWDGLTLAAVHDGEAALVLAREGRHADARVLIARARLVDPLSDRWKAEGAGAALALAAEARDSASREALLAEAEDLARAAVSASPLKAARHGLLSRVLVARGDGIGAAVAAERARQLAPFAPEWVTWAAETRRALTGEPAP